MEPTEAPTQAPTEAPTAEPTEEPTVPPVYPTEEPTAEPTVPPTTPPYVPTSGRYVLTGSIAGWGINYDYEMWRTDYPYAEEYVIEGVELRTSDSIKAIKLTKSGEYISEWYPDGIENDISVDANGIYNVYFRPNGDGDMSWHYSAYNWETGDGSGAHDHGGYLFYFELVEEIEPTEPPTQEPTAEPTEPVELITVYMTNTRGWENVYIYYWVNGGSIYSVNWPGISMSFYTYSDHGEQVLYANIPANASGIIFSDQYSGVQTVDITTGIEDGAGWSIANSTDEMGMYLVYPWGVPEPTEPPVVEHDYADIDGDGEISILDVTRLQRYLAEICSIDGGAYYELTPGNINFNAVDVDGDGRISIFDALRIQRYLVDLCNLDGSVG